MTGSGTEFSGDSPEGSSDVKVRAKMEPKDHALHHHLRIGLFDLSQDLARKIIILEGVHRDLYYQQAQQNPMYLYSTGVKLETTLQKLRMILRRTQYRVQRGSRLLVNWKLTRYRVNTLRDSGKTTSFVQELNINCIDFFSASSAFGGKSNKLSRRIKSLKQATATKER
ncbi:hypothetical protein BGZ83_010017 [Gryganskiella cystojenkinii]|nr:hypothetical protein BGZ83_010017 [Gryganskiella cystojenkinii]